MADFYWRIQFLSTPTTGNPDVWSYTRSPAPHLRQYVIVVLFRTDISRRSAVFRPCCFDSGFSCCCVVVEASLHPQFRREFSSFSYYFCENSTGFDVFCNIVRFVLCLLCCCRVSLQPQFHHFATNCRLCFLFCFACCVVVEFHSSHSVSIFAGRLDSPLVLRFQLSQPPSPTPGHSFCFF